jgi:GTP-binding protein
VILEELRSFSEHLAEKPMLVLATKVDACQDPARIETVRKKAEEHGYDFLEISSVTGTGIDALRFKIAGKLFAEAVPS